MAKRKQHSQRAHALLSASGAHRWMNCTPSARLEEEFGVRESSDFAAEGTLAHELAEAMLRLELGVIDQSQYDKIYDDITGHRLYSPDMDEYVEEGYVQHCLEDFRSAQAITPDAVALVEERVDLRAYIPESFGTNDFVIIADGMIYVNDLKYGKGVQVSAVHNEQLMLYALGSVEKNSLLYDIHTVRLGIYQPRLNAISTWEISVEDLYDWAENEVKQKAEEAYAGTGEAVAGDWCKFCAVKNRCRALADYQMEAAKYEFAPEACADPSLLLTDEEVADILRRAPKLSEWLNGIQEWAVKMAVEEGRQWPGFKVVEGRSLRKWADEQNAASTLLERFPALSEDQIYNMKLKGLTDLQKLVGKTAFDAKVADLLVKPQGKPTLVPESDKRPALGVEGAKEDFK